MLASNKPTGCLGQNPRRRKMNIRPQGYRGTQAKGPPSRQPAPSPAPPTANTLCSNPPFSLAGVASHRSRVGPEKHCPDAPNIPARWQCRFFSELVPVAVEDSKHLSGLLWRPEASPWRQRMSKDFGNYLWSLILCCSLLSQVITQPQAQWRQARTEPKPCDGPGSANGA